MNGYSSQGLLNVFFVFVTTDAGFMMECSNWSGSESLNLQFMVPKVGTLQIGKIYVCLRALNISQNWPARPVQSYRSFHPKVHSPDGVRQDLSQFARWRTTLYSMVNIFLQDVILVNLGFDMCRHCLSMLIPFFRLKKLQILFGWIDLTPYTEFIVTHDYPTESVNF